MRPIPLDPDICSPRIAPRGTRPGVVVATTTLVDLCRLARIPVRVSGGQDRSITCIAGGDHWLVDARDYFVGVGDGWSASRTSALRVLEVLAHGFHDYAARECVCGRGLFDASARRGRPPNGARAMTAGERMARMRESMRSR